MSKLDEVIKKYETEYGICMNYINGDWTCLESDMQTLERIPSWVKNKTYTVQQVKTVNNPNSKRAYLLKEIHSWVLQQDLE
ncbi:hypothetical protein [Enterococcus sp. LJL51]|uniref:hypothetical protein n=1 Tax=Enterococcus sp. LJL51 TaxID=3416656 RepID=UPI003CF1FC07